MPRELYHAVGGSWVMGPVIQAPQSPQFTFTPDPGNGLAVSFAGSATGGITPYTWAWTFGDGATATGQAPSHTYAAAGDYTVTMTVRGADNRANQRSRAITVAAGGSGGGAGATIFGCSMKVPAAAAPDELAAYKAQPSRIAALDYFDNELRAVSGFADRPMVRAFHTYDTTIPTSIAASAASDTPGRGMVIVHNMKASHTALSSGSLDSTIAALVATCPTNLPTYFVINHEPENDSTPSPAPWRAGVARFAKVVLDNRGTRRVYPTICHISFTFANLTEAEQWNPAPEMTALGVDLSQVCMAPDGYATSGNLDSTSPATLFDKCYNRMTTWGFSRWGISEVACKSYTSADRALAAGWVDSLARYADRWQIDYVTWFFSDVGNRAGTEGWYMYDDAEKRRFASACHYGGYGA